MKNQKGFTLVELLVVIAIIAVLSAVAVVNLNSARNKGIDASRQANLAALPAAAELFYDDNSLVYTGFCAGGDVANVNNALGTLVPATVCADGTDQWAFEAVLTGTNEFWCVDSTGFVGLIAASAIVADTNCDCDGAADDCDTPAGP